MNKTILQFIFLVLFSVVVNAQIPEKMSYQAIIRDANSILVTNQAIGMQISILQGGFSGSVVYSETQNITTNANGLVSLEIGSGTVVSGNFSTIDWSNNIYFIKTETDITGGTNYTIVGTSQLLSVPYALHAKTAANSFSGDYNDLNNAPTNLSDFNNDTNFTVIANGTTTNDVLVWNGTTWVATNICSLFTYYYADKDGDGFGDPFNTVFSCSQPTGYLTDNTDCDDNNFNINPNTIEICNGIDDNCDGQIDEGITPITQYIDADNDGYGDSSATANTSSCLLLTGYVLNNLDCDDTNMNINPGMAENPFDGIDNNCNSIVDECNSDADCGDWSNIDYDPPYLCISGNCVQGTYYYADTDLDGYGDVNNQVLSGPTAPIGYVLDNTDCNDNDPTMNPGAAELLNGYDDNCDGLVDEGFEICDDGVDNDGDGFIDCFDPDCSGFTGCDADGDGYSVSAGDCDDNNASINPGAIESCDGIDNNCNGQVDENAIDTVTYYFDADGDNFGDPLNSILACVPPNNYVNDNTDCDDTNPTIYPGAVDNSVDGIDQNCDGTDGV